MCIDLSHNHHHGHQNDHDHSEKSEHSKRITLEQSVLVKNDLIAEQNRRWFVEHDMRAINIISSPGAGKTSLLEKTIELWPSSKNVNLSFTILTGDQEQDFDAQRLSAKGAQSIKQLNTFNSCHLDASMIQNELGVFIKPDNDILIIENIGNLVCPAAFDLGEHEKIAILSVTEGEDKPAKYPLLFHKASLIVITKTDLLPYLDWDKRKCESYIRKLNRIANILYISSKTGEGMNSWLEYLFK